MTFQEDEKHEAEGAEMADTAFGDNRFVPNTKPIFQNFP